MTNRHYIDFSDTDVRFILTKVHPKILQDYESTVGVLDYANVVGLLNISGLENAADIMEIAPLKGRAYIEILEDNLMKIIESQQIINKGGKDKNLSPQEKEYKEMYEKYEKMPDGEEKERLSAQLDLMSCR